MKVAGLLWWRTFPQVTKTSKTLQIQQTAGEQHVRRREKNKTFKIKSCQSGFPTCRRQRAALAVFGLGPLNAVNLLEHALLPRAQAPVGRQRERGVLRAPDARGGSQRVRCHHLPVCSSETDRLNQFPPEKRRGAAATNAAEVPRMQMSSQSGCGGPHPPDRAPPSAHRFTSRCWRKVEPRQRRTYIYIYLLI